MDERPELLTKAAILYYLQDLTQSQIADRLGVSRQSVGRLLARARQTGIVEIKIRSPVLRTSDLEVKLEAAFGLTEAIVVRPAAEFEDARIEALGVTGARFLERAVRSGQVVGLSWGRALFQIARHLQSTPAVRVKVVQLNGSLVRNTNLVHAEYILQKAAEAFRAEPVVLAAPLLVERKAIRDSLLSDSQIVSALMLARRCQIAVFGIGSVSRESSLYKAGYLTASLLRTLRAQGAVGEICGRFYDRQGRLCAPGLDERTVAVELTDLRAKRLAVAVAGGPDKVDAMLGALAGRYCNVLVTDEATARTLLERHAAAAGGAPEETLRRRHDHRLPQPAGRRQFT